MNLTHFSLLILIVSINLKAISQTGQKQNQILFAEGFVGHSWGSAGGFSGGVELNFQKNRSLFTLRYATAVKLRSGILSPIVPLPYFEEKSELDEVSVLYGWRFIENARSFSFSLGFSHNSLRQLITDNNQKIIKASSYVGLPFEANIKWFKAEKKRFRIIYGLLPVGKPTAFGGSFGFKLFGNISTNSYGGASLVYGLGLHKKY
ncbi:MAG TPA: hypothetical protein VEZ55_08815 [Chitinophagaceae bacterium]|nr:hypothetical protein [Chitinophagaceae bacterium]